MEQDKMVAGNPPEINMQNVEELSRQLLQRKTTIPRFRFAVDAAELYWWLTSQYIAEVNYRQGNYIDGPDTRRHLWEISLCLTAENPKFGFLLCGTCGNGKTTMLYALQSVINIFADRGHFNFLGYKPGIRILDAKEVAMLSKDVAKLRELRELKMLAIDDMGKEPAEVMDYGNPTSPVLDLLEYRYQHQLFTAITTNLAPKSISEKYGERLADRFREMLKIISFTEDSFRGKTERKQK